MKISHKETLIERSTTRISGEKPKWRSASEIDGNFINKDNTKKEPLKQSSSSISFGGSFLKDFKKIVKFISGYNDEISDYKKIFEKIKKTTGINPQELLDSVKKQLPKNIKINNNKIQFKEKGVLRLVYEAAIYPIVKMPFDIINWALKSSSNIVKKLFKTNKDNIFDNIYNTKFLKNIRKKARAEEKYNALKGMVEQVSKVMNKTDADDTIFKISQKFFDPKAGKYNTVHERSLNRLVSGGVSTYFLANDAYNLASLVTNDPNESTKEGKIRRNQELVRIGTTAYLQLITLGALTQIVNATSWASPLIIATTVLLSETLSRTLAGKPVFFVNKEQAQKYNQIEEKKSGKKFVFTNTTSNSKDKTQNKKEEEKGLFTLNTLFKYVCLSIAIGLGGKGLKKIPQVKEFMDKVSSEYNKKYNQLTTKTLEVDKSDFEKLTKKLRENGFDKLADNYETMLKSLNQGDKIPEKIKLGKVNRKFAQPLVDFALGIPRFAKSCLMFPYKLFSSLISGITSIDVIKKSKVGEGIRDFMELNPKATKASKGIDKVGIMTNAYRDLNDKLSLNDKEFKKYVKNCSYNSFNNQNTSSKSNADMALVTKLISSGVASLFLIADNYNMVMLKSNGEDKEGAWQKAKERIVQRISSLMYSSMFIKLFNSTFESQYHKSLMGMSAITATSQAAMEVTSRSSIGMPILKKTKEQIEQLEEKNENARGLKGKYYQFMSKLIGKKKLSQRTTPKTNIQNA